MSKAKLDRVLKRVARRLREDKQAEKEALASLEKTMQFERETEKPQKLKTGTTRLAGQRAIIHEKTNHIPLPTLSPL